MLTQYAPSGCKALLPLMAITSLCLSTAATEEVFPEDFQRFELHLPDIDDRDMTLHLNYQNGRFIQGWLDANGRPVTSRMDLSQLVLGEDAINGSVDLVLGGGRRNNRFYMIELDAQVDADGSLSGSHQTRFGLELGHTYGSGFYIFTDDNLDDDTLVVTMDQLRYLRAGDTWS
ncbi:MAG: hypothetical protein EA401_01150, partial [Planctomycetota bacterium]